jgi:phosphotransferase system enzyme I (PtsI)
MAKSVIKGLAVSEGYASGPVVVINFAHPDIQSGKSPDFNIEIKQFNDAVRKSEDQIQNLIKKKGAFLGSDEKKIFEAHLMMIADPEFIDQIIVKIKEEQAYATRAVFEVAKGFADMLSALDDPYMQERSHDVKDISTRILRNLTGHSFELKKDAQRIVLVTNDITPSVVAELDEENTLAVVCSQGGATSHAAILLRNLEIPALFGVTNVTTLLHAGDKVLVDAVKGELALQPSENEEAQFSEKIKKYGIEKQELLDLKDKDALTQDGARVYLYANIGSPTEVAALKKYNPDGIGLFRTEFLYLERKAPPTEEEQFEIYKFTLQAMNNRKTIIRTLDIGGDKEVPFLRIPKEENPFLGLRGLRLCLEREEIFRPQIRALLRASSYGQLYVMYPMVTTVAEFLTAQKIVADEKEKLTQAGIKISPTIKYGIMIEIPAAALMAEAFVPYVDFFSLGTNDLIQYTCACDRQNPTVKNLYSSFEPAVYKLIEHTARISQKYNKELSICGEMGGQIKVTSFLLGTGIRHLSMSGTLIPKVKKKLKDLNFEDCKALIPQLNDAQTAQDVENILLKK